VSLPETILEVNKDIIPIKGTASNAKTVMINGEKIFVRGDGKFYVKKSLKKGVNRLVFKAFSKTEEMVTLVRTVKVVKKVKPHVIPKLSVSLPETMLKVKKDKISITGTASNAKTVMINGKKIFVRGDGKFYVKKSLRKGINIFKFKVFSKTGKLILLTRKVKRV